MKTKLLLYMISLVGSIVYLAMCIHVYMNSTVTLPKDTGLLILYISVCFLSAVLLSYKMKELLRDTVNMYKIILLGPSIGLTLAFGIYELPLVDKITVLLLTGFYAIYLFLLTETEKELT